VSRLASPYFAKRGDSMEKMCHACLGSSSSLSSHDNITKTSKNQVFGQLRNTQASKMYLQLQRDFNW